MTTQNPILVALVAALSLGGGCDVEEATGSDELGQAYRRPISTFYLNPGSWDRQICALGEPTGTYNAQITSKKAFGLGSCENHSVVLYPVPSQEITDEFCIALGLKLKVLGGGLRICSTEYALSEKVPVYCYEFSGSNTEVNYEVVDVGDGILFGSSGWQPGLDNGCPRDGFPW